MSNPEINEKEEEKIIRHSSRCKLKPDFPWKKLPF